MGHAAFYADDFGMVSDELALDLNHGKQVLAKLESLREFGPEHAR